MGQPDTQKKADRVSRRNFLKGSAAASAAVLASQAASSTAYAGGSDTIRVGIVGCGGRGTADAECCIKSAPGVELAAMGDLFEDRLNSSRNRLEQRLGDGMKVTDSRCFVGWDAYKKVLDCDIDMVLLTTPPHFRPMQFRAAVEAGKHVFMEKPVAVDPVGVRSVIETAEMAEQKGLGVLAGTQMRHKPVYVEVMKRVRDGAIGDLLAAQSYYCTGTLWVRRKRPEWSEMEWQVRNWLYFQWLSGDHIVEQDVHKLDILNWAFGGPPARALGVGGREVRKGPEHGNIFDHFSVEYVYPSGARAVNMCRQMKGAKHRLGEHIEGTKGKVVPTGGYSVKIVGENAYEYDGPMPNPSVQEHADHIASIRRGDPLNDGKRIAESTLTAILGRMSTYTGQEISWDWIMNESKLRLGPEKYEFGDVPIRPVPTPGQTQLV